MSVSLSLWLSACFLPFLISLSPLSSCLYLPSSLYSYLPSLLLLPLPLLSFPYPLPFSISLLLSLAPPSPILDLSPSIKPHHEHPSQPVGSSPGKRYPETVSRVRAIRLNHQLHETPTHKSKATHTSLAPINRPRKKKRAPAAHTST